MDTASLTVKSRIWIRHHQKTFLGKGRIDLLQAIKKHGSISKAAKSMNMSYLKAWKLINSMNKLSKKPLVMGSSGGKGGGGTVLTEDGIKAIALYAELAKKQEQFLEAELTQLTTKTK